MRPTPLRAVLPAIFVLLAARPAPAADSWIEVRSPSFVVVSDASEKDARRVAAQFERVRALLGREWRWARLDPSRPLLILAVRDESGMKTLAPAYWEKKDAAHPYGLFVGTPSSNWVLLRLDTARLIRDSGFRENPYRIVFHEYVHLLLRQNLKALPLWFNEGLAEYWGNVIMDDNRAQVGVPITEHILMLRARPLLPLARLFGVTTTSADYSERDHATVFYAESWALVHLLAVGSVDRRGQLNRFAERLLAGRSPEAAASECFGPLDALERELVDYVRQTSFRYRGKAFPVEVDEKAFTSRRLPPAESLAVRASFYAATRRTAETQALAAEALSFDPRSAMAHEALGLSSWAAGDDGAALRELGFAVALPEASDFAHYLYAVLLWRGASGAPSFDAVEASLRKAIALNPSFADAYDTLALVLAERGDPVERTLPLAVKAATLEPGEIRHNLNALRVAAKGGQVKEARAKAEQMLATATGEDREKIEALLRELPGPAGPAPVTCRAGDPSCAGAGPGLEANEPAPACDPAAPQRPDETPLHLLAERLRASDPATREAAAQSLANVRPVMRAALEALVEVLADPYPQVRDAARAALDRLSCAEGFAPVAAGLDHAPRPIRISRPDYPREAYARKVEGTVLVELLIGRQGYVLRARVLRSVPGLDEAALSSVRSWLFAPAVRGGRLVATTAQAPVAFQLGK